MCAKYERCDILHFETANPAMFHTFYEQKTICMIKTHNALITNDTISIVLVPDHAKIFISTLLRFSILTLTLTDLLLSRVCATSGFSER